LVHEEGHRICSDREGRVVFFTPDGRGVGGRAVGGKPVADVGRAPDLGADPVDDMIRDNRRRGAEPTWDTIMPRYHHTAPIPSELEADAWHALDSAGASTRSPGG
jgi:hypothetical protein